MISDYTETIIVGSMEMMLSPDYNIHTDKFRIFLYSLEIF